MPNARVGIMWFIRRERTLHATEEDRSLSRSSDLLLSRSVPLLTFPCPHAVVPASLFSAAKYTSVCMLEIPPKFLTFSRAQNAVQAGNRAPYILP